MPGNLCEHCTGLCCRYVALPIDAPEDRDDFDDIRWYLLHENVAVFVEDGEWYIYFGADCRHLRADFRCGIYATRPQICRDYTTENCDYHSGDYGWEHYFTCPEHLDEYVRAHGKITRRKAVRQKSHRPRLKARLRPHRSGQPRAAYGAATTDGRGTPLTALGVTR